jgi:uncharacterized membrane protein
VALTLFRWIHVLAASLWLGSLVFIIVVMRAPVQELAERTALDPMLVRVRRRFKGVLIATIAALAVSGIGALAVQNVPRTAVYIILIIAKILLSAGVIALFWYVAFVRQEPRKRPLETAATPGPTPPAGQSAQPSSEEIEDVDFFFRPKPRQAFVQWWIVGATAATVLLGLIAAHKGTGLTERREEKQLKVSTPKEQQEKPEPKPNE